VRFNKLLEPSYIGKVKIRNRIIKNGGGTLFCDDEGHITDEDLGHYEALARGGVGLIITEATLFDVPLSIPGHWARMFRVNDDKCLPGLSKLTRVTHKHGCPIFLELFHAGPWHAQEISGLQPLSASSLTRSELPEGEYQYDPPRGLTVAEIKGLVNGFVEAAERAQKAGFDGVEINAAHQHLLNAFFSRIWNKRDDAYGCTSLENRARFVVEIIQATKERLGQDFPISIRMNGAEYGADRGTTSEESQGLARILQDAGADAIDVSAYGYGYGEYSRLITPEQAFRPEPPKHLAETLDGSRHGAGAFVPLAAAIKKVVTIPVIVVGRLDPQLGEKALQQGKADFIGMNRRLFADPELPNKVAQGRPEDIAPCTACINCLGRAHLDQAVRCRINAAFGREWGYEIKPAEKKKKVVVVGGGPAGMEAARVAAMRGHEVTLYEREHKPGGLLPLAAMVKGLETEDLPAMVHYLKTQITKLGVKIRVGKEAGPSLIEEIKPDVVILATGGIPAVPDIPGINRRNVVINSALHRKLRSYLRFMGPGSLRWLTKFWMPIGKKVIIIGGGIQGCELAEFLVKRGRKVTIVNTSGEPGEGLVEVAKRRLFKWLAKKGTDTIDKARCDEITDSGLTIITREGKRQIIEADTIVLAMPMIPDKELLKAIEGKAPEIYQIGDCREPSLILEAIADGSRIGRAI